MGQHDAQRRAAWQVGAVASHDERAEQGDRHAPLWASWQAGLAAP